MAIVYNINFTDLSVPSFTINPGQVDGPNGSARNTSLNLHGTGRLDWGEAVNENFLKLLESSASPQRPMPISKEIVAADNSGLITTHTIEIEGDFTSVFNPAGFTFDITGSTGGVNDGTYTVVSSSFVDPNTVITLEEALPDDSAADNGDVTYTIIEADPALISPPYVIGQVWLNKTDNKVYMFKEVSTGIFQWIIIGDGSSVAVSPGTEPPFFPEDGTLWFDETEEQLKVFHSGTFDSVADRYVLKSGDTMTGDGTGSVGETNGVLKFNNGTTDFLFIGEGQAAVVDAPDIRADGSMSQSADVNFHILVDGNNDTTGFFRVSKGSHSTTTATDLFTIENDGTLSVNTANYETLVTSNNDIPNKKYVDDEITTSGGNFVQKAGDTMTGDGTGSVGETNGVLKFNNGTIDFLYIGEGQGNVGNAPDIRANASMSQSADDHFHILVDGNNDTTGFFRVSKGSHSTTTATDLFTIENDGTLSVNTANYETLVTSNNDIPNKKYVDDEIQAVTGGDQVVHFEPTTPTEGDIQVTGSGATLKIFIFGDGAYRQVFPALYAS